MLHIGDFSVLVRYVLRLFACLVGPQPGIQQGFVSMLAFHSKIYLWNKLPVGRAIT